MSNELVSQFHQSYRTPTLNRKMAEVMAAVDRIPKRGKNSFHGYKYATEADVSDAIRQELAQRSVAVYLSSNLMEVRKAETSTGKPTLLTDVALTITFADGESGEEKTIDAYGTGEDTTDKGSFKAITGALKYALMKTFLVPTGDDPEDDSTGDTAAQAKLAAMTAKLNKAGQ